MKKISLNNMEVIADLQWTVVHSPNHDDLPEKKAMAKFLAENKGSKRGVVLRANGNTLVGRSTSKTFVPKNIPSAAALLALANQRAIQDAGGLSSEATSEEHNWIVVEQVDGTADQFWLGVVKNGVPIPGGDLVGAREDIINELTDIISVSSNFTVYTVDDEIRYHVGGLTQVVDKRFTDLVQGVPTKKAQIALFSIGMFVAIGVIAGAVLLVGGWWGYETWAESRRQELARRAAAAQQQAQQQKISLETKKYEQEVRTAVLKALHESMADVTNRLGSPSPADTIGGWRDIIYRLDLYQSSWQMSGMECTMEAETPMCVVRLRRGDLGTDRSLLNDHPEAQINNSEASYTINGTELSKRPVVLHNVSSGMTFNKGVLSDLQQLRSSGLHYSADASKEIVKSIPIPAPPAILPTNAPTTPAKGEGTSSASINLGFASGPLQLKGDDFWQLAGIGQYLNIPNIRITKLAVTFSANNVERASWVMEVDYLVRTAPQPSIPPIPVGDSKIVIELPPEYRSQVPVDTGVSESSGAAVVSNPTDPNEAATQTPAESNDTPPTP